MYQLPMNDQIEEVRFELTSLDKARKDALEDHITGLDQDEVSLGYGAEDEARETSVVTIDSAIDELEELQTELEDVGRDPSAAGNDALIEELTACRDRKLSNIREALAEFRQQLKDVGIEPEA